MNSKYLEIKIYLIKYIESIFTSTYTGKHLKTQKKNNSENNFKTKLKINEIRNS